MSKAWDVVVLTQKSYVDPVNPKGYVQNVLLEDELVVQGLKKQNLRLKDVVS